MTVRAILFATTILASTSASAGILSCPLPNLATCRDPSYYDTDCGMIREARCITLLQNSYQSQWTATTTHKVTVEPAGMPQAGFRGDSAVVPFDPSQMVLNPTDASPLQSYQTATTPSIFSMQRYKSAPAMELAPAITSCTDYVTKKFFDYVRFESAAHACGANLECVYQAGRAMLGPQTLYSLVDSSHSATPIVPQIRPPVSTITHNVQPKNSFFVIPPQQIFAYSKKYATDPGTAAIQTAIMSVPPTIDTGDRWAWHAAMHDRNTAEGLVDDDYLEQAQRMDAYRVKEEQLLALLASQNAAARNDMIDSCGNVLYIPGSEDFVPPSIGGGGSVPPPPPESCTPPPPSVIQQMIDNLRDSMAADLIAEWHHTRNGVEDHGCLDPSSVRCDWSPKKFANEYVGRLQSEREAAYGACVNATGGTMPADPAQKADWIYLEAYFAQAFARMAEQAKLLPWKEENGVPSTNTLRIQGPKGGQSMGLPNVLAGEYRYDLWWELTGKTKATAAGPQLCRLESELSGSIYAAFTAPSQQEQYNLEKPNPIGWGLSTHKIIDGYIDVYLQRKGDAFGLDRGLVLFDEIVMPRYTYHFPNGETHTVTSPLFQQTQKLYEYKDATDVFGIPVYVDVHIDGTAGFDFSVTATPPPADSCTSPTADTHNLAGALSATLTPYGNIHATASAGVGIEDILSVGVQGDLDVITARMPITETLSVAAADSLSPELQLGFNAHLDADIMAGSISVFAEALTERADKELVRWPGKKWTEDVPTKTISIPLGMFNTVFH